MSNRADRERTIRRSYAAQVERIRADENLSDVGRRARLAQLKLEADARLAAIDAEGEAEFKRDRDLLVERLFGGRSDGAEYHAALKEADQIRSPQQMLDTLRLARLSGHTALVRAIGAAAENRARAPFGRNQWQGVLAEWAQDTDTQQDLAQLQDVDEPQSPRHQFRDRLFREMRTPSAAEVQGHDLRHLAAQSDPDDQEN
jgi:hypothetical protein